MSKLGATEAAKQWGVSRQLIYKDMKRGKLSYSVNNSGQREIDVSELSRVYGEPDTNVHNDHEDTVTPVNDPVSDITADYIDTLKRQLAEKDAQLSIKDEQLSQRDVQVQSLIDQLSLDSEGFRVYN